jgi:hypothetical protein
VSIYVLPAVSGVKHYDFSTDLEGSVYTFEIYWNERAEAWFLSVSDASGNAIVSGRKVVLGAPLLGRAVLSSGPPGRLIAVDMSKEDREPGLNDLGDRVQLVYFESTEP